MSEPSTRGQEESQCQLCPKCSYLLVGLPDVHACPECGLDYDPNSVVIRLQPRSSVYRRLVDAALLFGVGYSSILISSKFWGDKYVIIALVTLCLVTAVYRFSRIAGASALLILNHHGVKIDSPLFDHSTIPWRVVGNAERSWVTGKFILYGRDGRRLFTIQGEKLGTPRIVRDCVWEINRLRPVYSAKGVAKD